MGVWRSCCGPSVPHEKLPESRRNARYLRLPPRTRTVDTLRTATATQQHREMEGLSRVTRTRGCEAETARHGTASATRRQLSRGQRRMQQRRSVREGNDKDRRGQVMKAAGGGRGAAARAVLSDERMGRVMGCRWLCVVCSADLLVPILVLAAGLPISCFLFFW